MFEELNSLVQKAFIKYKDDNKFNFQYVSVIVIAEYPSDRQPTIHINMRGQLKSNEMEKDERVDIPLKNALK